MCPSPRAQKKVASFHAGQPSPAASRNPFRGASLNASQKPSRSASRAASQSASQRASHNASPLGLRPPAAVAADPAGCVPLGWRRGGSVGDDGDATDDYTLSPEDRRAGTSHGSDATLAAAPPLPPHPSLPCSFPSLYRLSPQSGEAHSDPDAPAKRARLAAQPCEHAGTAMDSPPAFLHAAPQAALHEAPSVDAELGRYLDGLL